MLTIKNIFNWYKERYHIPVSDLADSAETNRLHLLFSTALLFIFGVISLCVIMFLNREDISKAIGSLVYFGSFAVISIIGFLYSLAVKDVQRNTAYYYKTMPFYLVFIVAQGAALYNFFYLGQPFNGFVVCGLIGFVSLCLFSFAPFPFFIMILIVVGLMSPTLYRNFHGTGLADVIISVVLMLCLALYKRRTEKRYITMLKKQKNKLVAKTFGNFTLMYENKIIKFSRTKTNELVGYLIYKRGSSVRSKELISVLWGDQADSARYGNNLRNLIVDIKHSLAELEIENFFIAEYNNFRINPELVHCDYYDFLAGDKDAINSFAGEFMSQYSWAEDVAGFLEKKVLN